MKVLIDSIFVESGFINEESSNIYFYRKNSTERVEYYLIVFISKEELEKFNQSTLLRVHELFQEKKKLLKDVSNNTSLIICVEFSSFVTDCIKYKNRMLSIEEDDYWFKKYILPYTPNSAESLSESNNIVSYLNSIVSNETLFEEFTTQIFSNEQYFLTIQLFLKLPFLNININSEQKLDTIQQLLSTRISDFEQNFMSEILLSFPFGSFNGDRLREEILNPNNQSFDIFINSFPRNASDT